ncbi:hypothetical protein [Nocardia sp. NPDC049149]|uniref:hypothetical protein n=1 Tax=Nocardia sp. NPDC049149 TaxID=3364315 RepID=UPI00371E440B
MGQQAVHRHRRRPELADNTADVHGHRDRPRDHHGHDHTENDHGYRDRPRQHDGDHDDNVTGEVVQPGADQLRYRIRGQDTNGDTDSRARADDDNDTVAHDNPDVDDNSDIDFDEADHHPRMQVDGVSDNCRLDLGS